MDYIKAQELSGLCSKQIELAKEYKDVREASGKAKSQLEIILASKLPQIREKKPNAGYDMAILMLMEKDTVARGLREEVETLTAKYKGLEKLIDAIQSKISFEQSVMKYIHKGEIFG